MHTDPLISIITVVYNGAKYIEETLESLANQSYKNLEHIIIDGGSKDGTLDIINKYISGVAILISEKDDGIYDAMNKGISLANGDLVGILNSDDCFYDNYVMEKIVTHYNENPKADIIYGNIEINRAGSFGKNKIVRGDHTIFLKKLRMTIPHPAVFIKKNIYQKYGLYDTDFRIGADFNYVMFLLQKNVEFTHLDTTLVTFRDGGISDTKSFAGIITLMHEYFVACERNGISKLKTWRRSFGLLAHSILNRYFQL